MKIETYSKGDSSIVYELHFEDLFELISFINETEPSEKWGSKTSLASIGGSEYFTGTSSLEEAKELCIHGVGENFGNLLEMKDNLDKAFPILTQKRKSSESVYGFRPNIQKYLTNNPRSMYKLERKEEHKFLTIYFNVSVFGDISKEAFTNRGIILMSLIKLLESSDYRVELNFLNLCKKKGTIENKKEITEYIYITVNIKKQAQILDKNICFFPMCHPSFQRRIMFAVRERCDVKQLSWSAGYGSSLDKDETAAFLGLDSSSIIISNPYELGIRGNNIYEDTERFLRNIDFSKYVSLNKEIEFDSEQNKFILSRTK